MKRSLAALSLLGISGCALSSGLADPHIHVAPIYGQMGLHGDLKMQSLNVSGMPSAGVHDNPQVRLSDLGGGQRDDALGGTISLGDGFAGFDLRYFRMDNKSSRIATTPTAFGNIEAGDRVNTEVDIEEFRLRYVHQLLETELHGDVRLQLGAGGDLTHRKMDVAVHEHGTNGSPTSSNQSFSASDDGVFYLVARGRARWRWFGLQLDYGISPDLQIGGDFHGTMQDAELMGTFTVEDQDLTIFAGLRYTNLPSSGSEGKLDYRTDLVMDGAFVGIEFGF